MEPTGFTTVYGSRTKAKAAKAAANAANAAKAAANAAKRAANNAATRRRYEIERAAAKENAYTKAITELEAFYGKEEAAKMLQNTMKITHSGLLGENQKYNKYTAAAALIPVLRANQRNADWSRRDREATQRIAAAAMKKYGKGGKRNTRRAQKSKRKTRRRS
jgi:hypothetical protein